MSKNRIEPLLVTPKTSLLEVLQRQANAAQASLPAGIALVVDAAGVLLGTITDGDVRRTILKHATLDVHAEACMQPNPIAFPDTMSFQQILQQLPRELEKRQRMTRRFLGKIVLVDEQRRPTR